MTTLTPTECSLLQRYYDGDDLAGAEVTQVQELLNSSSTARVFMSALEELTTTVRIAEEVAWERAGAPSASSLVDFALQAASLSDAPLEEIAPLLERFFDGEVVPEEMAVVQALMNERDDVADYLGELDTLRASVRVGNEQVLGAASFDGFWDALESKIGPEEKKPVATPAAGDFDADEHRVLLYRYHDDEVSASERARVDAWIASGEPQVVATLAALGEIRLATVTAIETTAERVDFSALWHRVEDAIDDQIESQGENVVSLAREKRERKTGGGIGDSRFAAWSAIAAMLFLAFGAGLFKDQLFGPSERVIVEKTVVIVDSVEYQPGASVMVNSPMKPVSSISAADGSAEVEEEPTVIWLLDTTGDEEPKMAPPAEGDVETDETTEETSDQPI